ncbi:DNA-binding protein [Mesorhizobium denitrificans]|uniref:DNA-binding protein n=1 Tax=Mesorhizobium denitrificans TaxID=2294114 RepID=A0A371XDZ4_9HYPH|nr:DNA-binding protein [Mesorhizobium denitrificans]RFC67413.1 DNA-binding protein [Mesorhizobium denitrificans]
MLAEPIRLITAADFRETANIGKTKFYEEVAAGRLRVRKVGRKTLIDARDAIAWRDALPSNVKGAR